MNTDRELADRLVATIPELRLAYEEELAWWGDEQPGAHIVYGDLLNPYLGSLLESGDRPDQVTRVFNLLEELANDCVSAQEVVQVTVCEKLIQKDEWLLAAWPHMGPATRQLARRASKYTGGGLSQSLLKDA